MERVDSEVFARLLNRMNLQKLSAEECAIVLRYMRVNQALVKDRYSQVC